MEKGMDAYKLKLIALAFMILDHVRMFLFNMVWPEWVSLLPRFVSPLFLYLLIEGFYHTGSRKKFMIRLCGAALIMMGGNVIINLLFHHVSSYTGRYTYFSLTGPHNIFLTLAILFALVWCLENIRNREKIVLNIVLVVILAFLCIFAEGGIELLPIAFILWFFHGKKSLQCIGIGVYSICLLMKTVISYFSGPRLTSFYVDLCFDNGWAIIFVIFFILLYNGERGKNTKFSKYLFYVIYPIHLWILMIIEYLIA